MKRRLFGTVALAAVALAVVLVSSASAAAPTYSNDFEANTNDWSIAFGGTITKQPNTYDNPGDYADDVAPSVAGSSFHARLDRTTCTTDTEGPEDAVRCSGPVSGWGGVTPAAFPVGGWSTQVDIYLDTEYANGNPDTFAGNMTDLLATPGSSAVKGTRFDFSSAINNTAGTHKRDFGFNVSTGYADDDCDGFVITGTTNVLRSGANPNVASNADCIAQDGWYTFKHTFSDDGGALKVLMEIIPVGSTTPEASWTILTGIDPITTVGCERYGWFANQEIWGLPIDNPSMTGCGTPPAPPHIGVIAPTATTCQQYRDNETTPMPVLEQLQYNTKGTTINAVSPGVFFYYTKVSGVVGDKVEITQDPDGGSVIPINQGQVVLYDASTCKVVKGWTPTVSSNGTATGTLPTGGAFIIGVKYNPSALKGAAVPNPTTVTYLFGTELDNATPVNIVIDESSINLVPKP